MAVRIVEMVRSIRLFSVLLLAGSSLFALPVDESAAPAQVPSHQELLKLIAEPAPVQAAAQGQPSFYSPETLYQYMDGGADIFVLYDVLTMLHQEYRAKEVDVTVDVFDMGSAEKAFGIYAAERSPRYDFISIGTEGYKNEGILNFLQDRYYVKLAGFGTGADAVLDAFARVLSQRIGANPGFPELLKQLPESHRKPHSEQYMPKDPLGHPFLSPAYVAAYGFGDQESKLFVSVAADDKGARERLDLLQKHLRSTGQCATAPELGEGAIRGSNSFEGTIAARVKGRYLVLVVNPIQGNEGLLKDATDALK